MSRKYITGMLCLLLHQISIAQTQDSLERLTRFINSPQYTSPCDLKLNYPKQHEQCQIEVREMTIRAGDTVSNEISSTETYYDNVAIEQEYYDGNFMDYKSVRRYWPERKVLTITESPQPWGYEVDSCVELYNTKGFLIARRYYEMVNFKIIKFSLRDYTYKDDTVLLKVVFKDNGTVTRINSFSYEEDHLVRADVRAIPDGHHRYFTYSYSSTNRDSIIYTTRFTPRNDGEIIKPRARDKEIKLDQDQSYESLVGILNKENLTRCKFLLNEKSIVVSLYDTSIYFEEYDKFDRKKSKTSWYNKNSNTCHIRHFRYQMNNESDRDRFK